MSWLVVTARASALAGVLLLTLPSTVAAAPPALACPATCDARCETCCSEWMLVAECPDGRSVPRTERYATFGDASAAAGKEAASTRCRDGQPPVPRPVCAPGKEEASPDETAALAPLVALEARLSAANAVLTSAESSLRTFASTRVVSTAGAKAGQPLFERLRSAWKLLRQTSVEVRQTRTKSSKPDVTRLDEQARQAASLAQLVANDVRAYVADPTNVDAAAEARERARVEAMAAAQRKKIEAEATAQARAAAELARREEAARKRDEEAAAKRAEAERLAAEAEAKKRAEAEAKERARLEAEAAARQAAALKLAERAKKAAAEEEAQRAKMANDSAEAEARIRADLDQCSQTIAMLTMVEMSSRGQAKVADAKVALQNHKDKLRALLGRLAAAKARVPLKDAAEEVSRTNEESKALSKETARLVAAAKATKS